MTKDSKHTTQLLVLKLFLKSLSSEILETGIREFRRPPSEVFFSFFFSTKGRPKAVLTSPDTKFKNKWQSGGIKLIFCDTELFRSCFESRFNVCVAFQECGAERFHFAPRLTCSGCESYARIPRDRSRNAALWNKHRLTLVLYSLLWCNNGWLAVISFLLSSQEQISELAFFRYITVILAA